MFQKLNTILKRRVHPFGLLGGSLAVVLLVTALSGMWHYQYELDHLSKSPSPVSLLGTKTNAKADSLQQTGNQITQGNSGQANKANTPNSKANNTNRTALAAAQINGSGSTSTNNSSGPSTVSVSLSVNGSYKGRATLASTSNQCDVLSEALGEGLISNLDMRYNAQYKTYAVYVINSIGDSNAIWWTYQVNGKSPPYGCSNTAVHSGDSVNWQYVKE